MISPAYRKEFKARFIGWWQLIFSLMVLILLYDLVVRLSSDLFMEWNTLVTYIAVLVITTVLATVLAVISPMLRIFLNPVVFKITGTVGIVTLANLYGWWVLFGLIYVFMWNGGGVSGGSGGSSSSADDDFRAFEEEQKRHDEWNNSHEKRARDYDQSDRYNNQSR